MAKTDKEKEKGLTPAPTPTPSEGGENNSSNETPGPEEEKEKGEGEIKEGEKPPFTPSVTDKVQQNDLAQREENERKINEEVERRLKERLKQAGDDSVLLDAEDYEPRYQKTRIPTHEKAHMMPLAWETVEKEDFTAEHAQALIDHFKRHSEKTKGFDMMKAVNTQLVRKRAIE